MSTVRRKCCALDEKACSIRKRVLLYSIMVIILTVAIFIVYKCSQNNKYENKELLYSYSQKRGLDYVVNINENSFISSPFLESGKTYISDLVKDIDANLNYTFSGSKKIKRKLCI